MACTPLSQHVRDTRDEPWRWICSVRVRFPEKVRYFESDPLADISFGTGLLIGPRHVLTAAHLLYRFRWSGGTPFGVNASSASVVPGRNDDAVRSRPYGDKRARAWAVPVAFKSHSPNIGYPSSADCAVIELRTNVSGWWRPAANSYLQAVTSDARRALASRCVNVAGYAESLDPAFTESETPGGLLQHSFDRVRSVTPTMIMHDAWTDVGMSGGPIWTFDKEAGRRRLTGIQTGNTGSASHGVLLTQTVLDFAHAKGAPV